MTSPTLCGSIGAVVTPVRDREAVDQAIVRGSDALKQGKLDEAVRAFRQALELDPENTKVLALLGLTLFRGNQFADARPIYEQLVELASTDASHRLNLGLVYLKLGEGDLAIHALEASRALDPSQGRAVSYLGLAYARAGRYAEAYRSFLIAGQNELASEIEANLTTAEREGIQAQLGMTARADAAAPPAVEAAAMAPLPSRPSSPGIGARAPKPVGIGDAQLSSPEITIERVPEPAAPPRLTDSQIFVLPKTESAVPEQRPGDLSMVSLAVAAVEPSPVTAPRTPAGGFAPRPLSELATDQLVRPDEGDDAFELTAAGALVIRVVERVFARLAGIHVSGGDLAFEPATRRSRGHQTDEKFDYGGVPLAAITGKGYLIASPGKHVFAAVALDDDILYLREDLVFAFEGALRWENGNVPGLRGKLPVVQFRGDGALVVRSHAPLTRVKLPAQGVVYVDAERIAGWIGRVIPRAVVPPSGGPMGAMCIECTGEGIVLVEPTPEPDLRAELNAAIAAAITAASAPTAASANPSGARSAPPPPPGAPPRDTVSEEPAPPAPPEVAPELVDFAREIAAHNAAADDDVPPGRDEF